MASGDVFGNLGRMDFYSGQGPLTQMFDRETGLFSGLALGKGNGNPPPGDVWYALARVWNNGAPLATGVTVQLAITDDPRMPSSGKVAVLGISGSLLTSATTDFNAITWGTEVTGNFTAPATPTIVSLVSFALPKANFNGTLAAGNWFALRIRRLPLNASDTHGGRPLLCGASLQDT